MGEVLRSAVMSGEAGVALAMLGLAEQARSSEENGSAGIAWKSMAWIGADGSGKAGNAKWLNRETPTHHAIVGNRTHGSDPQRRRSPPARCR